MMFGCDGISKGYVTPIFFKEGKKMDREARDLIESAVSVLIVMQPIYGTVFLYLNKVETTSIPTMGVGPYRNTDLALYYNPEFTKSLSPVQRRAVLKHEALHILLNHLGRAQYYSYAPKAFNIAADMAINCHIEGLPENGIFPKTMGFPDFESADYYYNNLPKQDEELAALPSLQGKSLIDSHDDWHGTGADNEIISEKVRSISERAIREQEKKGWGDIAGKLAQSIIAANKPVVNWKKEVRYFVNQIVLAGKRSTRMRPNRRFGYVNPGSKRDYTSSILVAIDTSGSVSDKLLQYFLAELNGMISCVKVDLIMFDTVLYDKPEPFDKKRKDVKIKGRGGTCFEPPIKLADELGYDGLVMFTDGYAPFPAKPKTRMLWCVHEADSKTTFPYGKKVVIKQKQ
jgi:predicted metal-dependent peptidase